MLSGHFNKYEVIEVPGVASSAMWRLFWWKEFLLTSDNLIVSAKAPNFSGQWLPYKVGCDAVISIPSFPLPFVHLDQSVAVLITKFFHK